MTDATSHGALPQNRRDMLFIATGAAVAVHAAATAWPFVDQMKPDAQSIARGGPFDVDLGPLQLGQQIVAEWREHPVFIVSRSPEALKTLTARISAALLTLPQGRLAARRRRLAGRLVLTVPRLEIRPRRAGFRGRAGALQPAGSARSSAPSENTADRREPNRTDV